MLSTAIALILAARIKILLECSGVSGVFRQILFSKLLISNQKREPNIPIKLYSLIDQSFNSISGTFLDFQVECFFFFFLDR